MRTREAKLWADVNTRVWDDLIARVNPKYFRYLGRGAYARVWRIDEFRVLKITEDHTDAQMAELLRHRRLVWAPKVHDVFKSYCRTGAPRFFVVTEYCPRPVNYRIWNAGLSYIDYRDVEDDSAFPQHIVRWCKTVQRWLDQYELFWADAHADNVRYNRAGRVVITDFGRMSGDLLKEAPIARLK